jgi:hypothetical protein
LDRDYQKDLEICKKATPGPWEVEKKIPFYDLHRIVPQIVNKDSVIIFNECHYAPKDLHDWTFIATAREALPYYIKRCMELAEALQKILCVKADGSLPDQWDCSTGGAGHSKCREIARSVLKED